LTARSAMDIAVLIKIVPDSESRLEVRGGKLDESDFKYMVNPYDEFAVEQAVQFKEVAGGKVTLVALFSETSSIDTDLRKMLAIGADEVIVLRQSDYRGDRPAGNATVLAEALKPLQPDLVLCGVQGIDYYQCATGPMVAHQLGIPHIASVTQLELANDKLKAWRQVEGGLQVIETSMPALITCQKDLNKVRFPALKDIMFSKKKPFENRAVPAATGPDLTCAQASLPPARGGGEIIDGKTPAEKVTTLLSKLRTEAKVL